MTERQHLQRLLTGVVVLFVALLVGTFAQSYNGRRNVVISQRHACLAFGRTVLVPLANSLRADEIGNSLVASDRRQPEKTRHARASEAAVERQTLLLIDHRIDTRLLSGLNPIGQRIIRRLERQGRGFSCDRAYPSASPFDFVN